MSNDWHSTGPTPVMGVGPDVVGIAPMPTMIPDPRVWRGGDLMERRIPTTVMAEPRMQMMKPAFSVYVIGNGFLVSFDGVLENSYFASNEQELADLLVAKKVKEKIAPEPEFKSETATVAYRAHTKPIRQIGDQNGKHF